MLSYEECKEIAESIARNHNATLVRAYRIRNDFVFEAAGNWAGVFPAVIFSENGDTMGLWLYLNKYDLRMDDAVDIPL